MLECTKRFLEWFWFRNEISYKRKIHPLRIVKIRGIRTFLVENYPSTGRMGVQMLWPWEKI